MDIQQKDAKQGWSTDDADLDVTELARLSLRLLGARLVPTPLLTVESFFICNQLTPEYAVRIEV
ncbi:MAG TPA: hypothetical protein VF597_03150 [Candidatus Saccharimonadales bacterium]|jgi:hypothetical protein